MEDEIFLALHTLRRDNMHLSFLFCKCSHIRKSVAWDRYCEN